MAFITATHFLEELFVTLHPLCHLDWITPGTMAFNSMQKSVFVLSVFVVHKRVESVTKQHTDNLPLLKERCEKLLCLNVPAFCLYFTVLFPVIK